MPSATLPRSFPATAVTARHQEVIRLRALATPVPEIARQLQMTPAAVAKLLRRALSAQARSLMTEEAWQEAAALYLARLELLLEKWLPAAVGSHPDKDAADVVLSIMGKYADLYGFKKPIELSVTTPDTGQEHADARARAIGDVLGRLDEIGRRHATVAVDAELVQDTA